MTALAFAQCRMDSSTLAASVNTNPVVVRRLLLALAPRRLDRNPGWQKRRRPTKPHAAAITLLDIYDAVEPRPVIARNERKAMRHCPVSCQMKNIMSDVAEGTEAAVRKHLRGIPLQSLLRQVEG